MACLEIVNGPMTVYWAPVGTAFPDTDDDDAAIIAASFVKIGTSGPNNYADDGVEIEMAQTLEAQRVLGSTYPACYFRTEQDVKVRLTMLDLSLDELRIAMNLNTVTTDAGPPAIKHIDLDYGVTVSEVALLVRGFGKSPEFAGGELQFEIYRCAEMSAHTLTFAKGEGAGVELEFAAMVDSSGNVGRIVASTS